MNWEIAPVSSSEICKIDAPCFARGSLSGRCKILTPPLPVNRCSFCKPDRTVTNGKYYPDNYNYVGGK